MTWMGARGERECLSWMPRGSLEESPVSRHQACTYKVFLLFFCSSSFFCSFHLSLDAAPGRPDSGVPSSRRAAPMLEHRGLDLVVDLVRYPLADRTLRERCARTLEEEGALVLPKFLHRPAIDDALTQSLAREADAFFCTRSHNVFLLEPDPELPSDHPRNREVRSSKGILADDQVDPQSPLRTLYDSTLFREFLRSVTRANGPLHPYADSLASVNVHVQRAGQELGWHFDNSSFAATVMLRPASSGGSFEYCPGTDRDAWDEREVMGAVTRCLDGDGPIRTLTPGPGDLTLFRGRRALHRVTPTGENGDARVIAVLAYNETPGQRLSSTAMTTFFGRLG